MTQGKNPPENTGQFSTGEFKAFDALCKQDFVCETDACKALAIFEKKQKITFVSDVQVMATPRYLGQGRPIKDKEPDYYVYRIVCGIASKPQERNRRLERKSCFILATNQLDYDTYCLTKHSSPPTKINRKSNAVFVSSKTPCSWLQRCF